MLTRPPFKLASAFAATASVALLAGCGAVSAPKAAGSSASPSPSASSSSTSSPSASSPTAAASGKCQYVPSGQPAARKVNTPPSTPVLTPNRMVIKTNFGAIPVTFKSFDKSAPCAVSNFISLAKQGYFDKTPCHRITDYPTFKVLQCGDPTGQGTGDPGYAFAAELSKKDEAMARANQPTVYPAGVVAMANTGQPVSQGSQFFLVFGDTQLPPAYTKFAMMSPSGVKVIDRIAKNGLIPNPQMGPKDGAPKKPVMIQSVQ